MHRLNEKKISRNDGTTRTVWVRHTELDMNMADQWHERFLWKPQKRTIFNDLRSLRDTIRRKGKADASIGEGLWRYVNDTGINTPRADGVVVVYQRSVESPYLEELDRLQTECEDIIEEIYENEMKIENAENEMKRIWARLFRTERERQLLIIQKTKQRMNELYPNVERLLKDADQLRSVILQQKSQKNVSSSRTM